MRADHETQQAGVGEQLVGAAVDDEADVGDTAKACPAGVEDGRSQKIPRIMAASRGDGGAVAVEHVSVEQVELGIEGPSGQPGCWMQRHWGFHEPAPVTIISGMAARMMYSVTSTGSTPVASTPTPITRQMIMAS